MKYNSRPLAERFWEKVNKDGPRILATPCWEWTGSKVPNGYGDIWINGKHQRSHRVSFEMENGKIPPGLLVCHRCDNRACVRPEHLFLGTTEDNAKDCSAKKRHNNKGRPNSTAFIRDEVARRLLSGVKQGAIAEEFNISLRSVQRIAKLSREGGIPTINHQGGRE